MIILMAEMNRTIHNNSTTSIMICRFTSIQTAFHIFVRFGPWLSSHYTKCMCAVVVAVAVVVVCWNILHWKYSAFRPHRQLIGSHNDIWLNTTFIHCTGRIHKNSYRSRLRKKLQFQLPTNRPTDQPNRNRNSFLGNRKQREKKNKRTHIDTDTHTCAYFLLKSKEMTISQLVNLIQIGLVNVLCVALSERVNDIEAPLMHTNQDWQWWLHMMAVYVAKKVKANAHWVPVRWSTTERLKCNGYESVCMFNDFLRPLYSNQIMLSLTFNSQVHFVRYMRCSSN